MKISRKNLNLSTVYFTIAQHVCFLIFLYNIVCLMKKKTIKSILFILEKKSILKFLVLRKIYFLSKSNINNYCSYRYFLELFNCNSYIDIGTIIFIILRFTRLTVFYLNYNNFTGNLF